MSIRDLLNSNRRELLDISTRNRLLSIPIDSSSARIVQIRGASSDDVFHLLVSEKKSISFLPARKKEDNKSGLGLESGEESEANQEIELPQPEEEKAEPDGTQKKPAALRLQTSLSPEGLQRRLLDLYRDARTIVEEQGVNILYLAL